MPDPDRASAFLPFLALLGGAGLIATDLQAISFPEAGAVMVIIGSNSLDSTELRNTLLARLPRKEANRA